MTYLAILAGGALGSLARALLWAPGPGWVTSSIVANGLACLAIGWLHALAGTVSARALLFGAVGFCGGLSTFSAFAADVAGLARSGRWAQAVVAPGVEIALGLVAAAVGERLGGRHAARRGVVPGPRGPGA